MAKGGKNTIPETLLKKRKTQQQVKADRVARATAKRATRASKRGEIFQRAEKYVREYRSSERALIRARRSAKKAGNYFVEPEARLGFVVRIRGINGVDPKSKKILQLLRLRQIHNGVFVKLNSASLEMLRLVQPYIAWGYPNLKSVKELIYKRGHGKVNNQRLPLNDNSVIERSLGAEGLICMEDLVHEIQTVGPAFTKANNFLWPFKLSSPNGGFRSITNHFIQGGDAGNREARINALIRQMN
eukprot:TRINITY_DN14615_c0_g1_i1.p2 TRINITY_DN14615_c0_g1~~TRINITY_DN14615_c0_g1_i1.p2  ORF type:complete len:268 (-),score=153.19 TRINITY_DN14615_c0_g1_i1:44-775(-)